MMRLHLKQGAALDSITLTIAKFLTIFISFFITKILSERLNLELYGEYSASRMVVDIGKDFCILGLLDAANYFYMRSKDSQEREQIVSHILYISGFTAGIFAVLATLFRKQIADYFGIPDMGKIILFAAWVPMAINFVAIYQLLFIAIQKAKVISIFSFAASFVKLIYTTVICLSTLSIQTIFICMLFAEAIQALVMMLLFSRISGLPLRFVPVNMSLIRRILSFAVPMGAYIWVNTLNREIDKLVVGNLGTTAELALYTNAAKQLPFDIFTASFITVLVPYITYYLAHGKNKKAADVFSSYLQLSLISVWGLAGGVFLAPDGIISILYSDQYTVVKTVFLIYVIVDMIRIAQTPVIFSAMHQGRSLLRYSIFTLLSNLVLNIGLFPLLGIVGPAIATLAVNLFMTLYLLSKSASLIGEPISSFLSGHIFFNHCLLFFICMIAGSLIHYFVLMGNFIPEIEFIVTYAGYIIITVLVFQKKVRRLLTDINRFKMTE